MYIDESNSTFLEFIVITFIWSEKLLRYHSLFEGSVCKGKIEKMDTEHLTRDGKPYYVEVSYGNEEKKNQAKIKRKWNDSIGKEVKIVVSNKHKEHIIREKSSLEASTILGTIMVFISSVFIINRTNFYWQTGLLLIYACDSMAGVFSKYIFCIFRFYKR